MHKLAASNYENIFKIVTLVDCSTTHLDVDGDEVDERFLGRLAVVLPAGDPDDVAADDGAVPVLANLAVRAVLLVGALGDLDLELILKNKFRPLIIACNKSVPLKTVKTESILFSRRGIKCNNFVVQVLYKETIMGAK
jgi:hypothetical protein